MKYKRFANTIIARFDKNEEILEQLQSIAEREKVLLAEVSALGAVSDITVGVYNVAEKKYYSNSFQGMFEIVSLTGTISTMNGAYYAHLHMSVSNEKGNVYGGHLNRAVVSATCEMVIKVIEGTVDRVFDENVGLNLLRFD